MNSKDRLLTLLTDVAYEEKTVVLASGKTSDFYIDCRKASLHPEGLVLCGQALFQAAQDAHIQVDAVGGPALGAIPLVASFVYTAHTSQLPLPGFMVRKEAKTHGSAQRVEGADALVHNAPVLLLEDVVTTGGSTLRAIAACREAGLNPTHVLALVDRLDGGAAAIREANVAFHPLFTRADFPGGS